MMNYPELMGKQRLSGRRKGGEMIRAELALPEIGLIAVTRGLLGAGIALLFADRLHAEQRKSVGWTLVGVGALTTIPLLIDVFSKSKQSDSPSARSSESGVSTIPVIDDSY
jgi:hypothetical protein